MIAHKRIHITLTLLCHVLLASAWLTIKAQTLAPAPVAAPATAKSGELVTIQAQEQEKTGSVYHLRGNVEVTFRSYVLRAAQVEYNSDTGEIVATGYVTFDGGPHDEHLTATHGTYNVNSDTGRFYDVVGTTGVRVRGRMAVLTSTDPFSFSGRVVDKIGPDRIVVHYGVVTSCALPQPKWALHAKQADVVAGDKAKLYVSTFWLWRAPIFFLPFADHPVERLARQSGFLMPAYGHSSTKGMTLGEAFYWAINRSTDATLGAEYFSKRGWAQHGDFRKLLAPESYITAHYFGVLDRGLSSTVTVPNSNPSLPPITEPANQNQGGQDIRLTAVKPLRPDVRAVADLNYLSSYTFRQAFGETITAISSEVKSLAFVTDNRSGYSFSTMGSRYQDFQSTTPGDVITILHTPTLEASTADRPLGHSPFYWSFDANAGGLHRSEPNFVTQTLVGRIDVAPTLSLPLLWHGWSLRPQLTLRDTWYSDQRLPVGPLGEPLSAKLNRSSLETEVELRPPTLARVFDGTPFSQRWKHTIEPRVTYRYTTGVNNFQNTLLFDERDILSDTHEVEYGVVNRLYAKSAKATNCAPAPTPAKSPSPAAPGPPSPATMPDSDGQAPASPLTPPQTSRPPSSPTPTSSDCGPAAHEVASWELAQQYYFDPNFGGAVVPGRRNVFTTTEQLTGIAFLTAPRYQSPIVSRLRVRAPNADFEWQLDYDPHLDHINSSTALISYRVYGNLSMGGGHFFLRSPGEVVTGTSTAPTVVTSPSKFDQFRVNLTYGKPNRPGFTAATTFGIDLVQHTVQYSAVQSSYNWDCCGITLEYRRYNLGIRDENLIRFALSLSNLGTFGTLRKPERLY